MKEEFKTINYKGLIITVSNLGKVLVDGKERNWYFNHDGYAVCTLKIPNKGWRSVGIHILVANAFVPNPYNLPEVNHKDYDRHNPSADNLEWITHADNVRYSKCNMPDYHGSNNPNFGNHILSNKYANNKKLSKEKQGRQGIQNGRCRQIDLYYNGELIKSFEYISLCCQYLIEIGVTKSTSINTIRSQIDRCIRNDKTFKHHYSFKKR